MFTLYIVGKEYTNKGEEEEKRKLTAWVEVYGRSEELIFRANHRYIMNWNT